MHPDLGQAATRQPRNLPDGAGHRGRSAVDEGWAAFAQQLGENLLRARKSAGLSQERLANAAGISVLTYRRLEHGASHPPAVANPRLRTLITLAEVLDVRPENLLPRWHMV